MERDHRRRNGPPHCSLWLWFLVAAFVHVFVAGWIHVTDSVAFVAEHEKISVDAGTSLAGSFPSCDNSFPCGRCPELIYAAKNLLRQHNIITEWKIKVLQLVGQWPADSAMERVMEQVFHHNQQILQHMYAAPQTSLLDVVAIREAPITNIPTHLSPAFWKPLVAYHHCTDNPPNLIWFLDGDALIMDSSARIEFLWHHHTQQQQPHQLDMLFAHGRNGYNSGIFIVNCTSPTALATLQLWHAVALDLATSNDDNHVFQDHVRPAWYEQNALHYMLNTHQWRIQGNLSQRAQLSPRIWNEQRGKYAHILSANTADFAELFSTQALRKRLRHTTQCALQTFPPSRHNDPSFTYRPGHFILHTAGVKRAPRMAILQHYASFQPMDKPSTNWTLEQAAKAYLERHPYTYDINETYTDWVYPV